MAYNLELPSWIVEQPLREAQVGQALGRNILEGLRFQQQRMMYEEERPLREAQVASALAQNTMQQQKIEANALALGLQANAQAGMKDALALEADIASRPNGWLDPESQIRVGRLIQQYPGLNETPWHQRINQSIQTAQDQDFKVKQLERQLTGQREIEEIRQAGDIVQTQLQTQTRDTAKKPSYEEAYAAAIQAGKSPDEAHQDAAMSQAGGYKVNQAKFTVDNIAKTFDEVGIPYQPYEVRDTIARVVSGGVGAANVPAKTAEQIQTRYAVSKNLEGVGQRIEEFEKKYGPGSFSKYVGPVDNGVFRLQTKNIPREQLSQISEDARSIFQAVDFFVQEYRNQQFGASLTENETKLFERLVNNPSSASFVNSVKQFGELSRRAAAQTVSQNKWAANIPTEIKVEFLAPRNARQRTQQPAGTPTMMQGTTSSGLKYTIE